MLKDNLFIAREKKGFSREQLAELVGCATETIARYERGEREPKQSITNKLASVLDVSVSYLIGEHDDPERHVIAIRNATPTQENSLVIEIGEGANKKRYVLPATAESYDFLRKLSEASEPDVEPKKMAILKMMEDMSPEDIDRMFDFLSGEKSQTTVSA